MIVLLLHCGVWDHSVAIPSLNCENDIAEENLDDSNIYVGS